MKRVNMVLSQLLPGTWGRAWFLNAEILKQHESVTNDIMEASLVRMQPSYSHYLHYLAHLIYTIYTM